MQVTLQKDGMPSRDTRTNLRSANLMKSHKAKDKVLCLDQANPSRHEYRTEDKFTEKDLEVFMAEKMDLTQKCMHTAQKVKRVLGCTQSSVGSRAGRGFCPSALLW